MVNSLQLSLSSYLKSNITAKPFLKWAGGKSQLLPEIDKFLPTQLKKGEIKKYIEPFIGGGAVFFYIAQTYNIDEFFIIDINEELIIAYKTIQKNVEKLIELLNEIQNNYLFLNEVKRKQYFYQIREKFNLNKNKIDFKNYHKDWIERTAQLIFLNRTCFNGLFRVNSQGEFNVPMGKYKNPLICNAENLIAISNLLQNTIIHHGNFTKCESWVNDKTFVYFDPPYRPISTTSYFTAYSKYNFNDTKQLELRDFFDSLAKKNAKLMLSNSDPKNEDINDIFFDYAYEKYRIERVKASRNINSNPQKRGKITELLIMNYEI